MLWIVERSLHESGYNCRLGIRQCERGDRVELFSKK